MEPTKTTTAPPVNGAAVGATRGGSRSHPDKSFANQKFYRRDFSGQDLSHADFRCATLCECKFVNADLSYANMEGANCYRADFTGAKLYRTNMRDAVLAQAIMKPKDFFGVTLTMVCEAFDGAKVNSIWWYSWLYLALAMDGPLDATDPKEQEVTRKKLIDTIGKERYEALCRLFGQRSF